MMAAAGDLDRGWRDRLDVALARALDWLEEQTDAPGLEARSTRRGLEPHEPAAVRCGHLPFAVAHVAAAWQRVAARRVPPATLSGGLAACCDPDGWVRFYGPGAPGVIGPDVDDTCLVWAQRRALFGDEPPPGVVAGVEACRGPDGAFATWPDPPADGPRVEVDPVVNANVLALWGAMGRRDAPAEATVQRALAAVADGGSAGGHWYPDPGALVLAARRALRLGGLSSTLTLACPGRGLLAQLARAEREDLVAVLEAQREDGSWPWVAAFVGGELNVFPAGLPGQPVGAAPACMVRPEFGGPALTTALAIEVLADAAGWELAPIAPSRGAAAARPRGAPAWARAAGRLAAGVTLVRREVAGRAQPVLVGPDGELALEITDRSTTSRHYAAGEAWAVSYRGDRSPSPAEHGAIEALLRRLEDDDATEAPRGVPADLGPLRSTLPDAADVPPRLAAADHARGEEVSVDLSHALRVGAALPALAAGLDQAEQRGVTLRYTNLARCAVPWPDGRLSPAPARRPLARRCQQCSEAQVCAGPHADQRLRPIRHSTPWPSLRRVAADWRARTGYPGSDWDWILEALEDLPAGSLAGTRWSVTIALDVVAGELSPVFRVAAFYGRAGDVVPGTRVVTHLAGPWAEPAELLGPWAGELPTYPSLAAGPDGTSGSLYLDTSSLAPEAAWEVARAVGKAAGAAVPPPTTLPPLLGVSVARDPGSERLLFDVYSRWRPGAPGPWLPPASVLRTAGPGALVATLRQDAGGALVTRKWDVPWWSTGRSDQELADVLGVRGAGADALRDLLDSERYTLHPTTLALRPGGRRIYARVR